MNNVLILIGLLAFAVVNTGCGKGTYNVPAEFAPYVESFMLEAEQRGKEIEEKELEISFAEKLAGTQAVGECYTAAGVPTIRILISFWEYASEAKRENLIYHELGHCWLNRAHVDPPAVSIMSHTIINPGYYVAHRAELLNELFQ